MRLFILIALALSLSISVFSQENGMSAKPKEQRPIAPKEFNTFKERLYFGGNIGLGFGTTTYINLSPLVGCKITKQFSAGGGIVYDSNCDEEYQETLIKVGKILLILQEYFI